MPSILICDDHLAFREGLSHLITLIPKAIVCGHASHGQELIQALGNGLNPDIILLDICMPPGLNGYEVAKYITSQFPTIKIIMLSAYSGKDFISHVLEAGVRGFISKGADIETLALGINTVHDGLFFFNNTIFSNKREIIHNLQMSNKVLPLLTNRELQVARLMSSDKAYKQIASDLTISPNTVENIRVRIFEKTGSKTRTEVALYMMRLGILS